MKQIIIILILGIFCFGCSKDNLPNDLSFDSGVWKKANKRTRGRMVYDLQKSKILIGKTKIEIEELLGKSDNSNIEEGKLKSVLFFINTEVITDEYFTIHFDENTHKVISTDIGD